MVALHTPVELRRWFVSTSGLQEPPTRFIMAALRAFYLGRRKGVELVLRVPHDLDWRSDCQLLFRWLGHSLSSLVAVAAVITYIRDHDFTGALNLLQFEPRTAFRTELQPDPPPSSFSTLS